jgi:hypothetical protein
MATNEKRVTKCGKTRWDFRIRRQGHPLISRAFDTKTDGETWARGVERDLDLGQYKPPAQRNSDPRRHSPRVQHQVAPDRESARSRAAADQFHGTIADIDERIATESAPAALVLVIDCYDELAQVLVPIEVEQPPRELLAVGRPVLITGETAPASYLLTSRPVWSWCRSSTSLSRPSHRY